MTAPTKDEVAEARRFFTTEPTRSIMPPWCATHGETILRALDAAEAERIESVGALEDAGVDRNDADEIASGIEALAKDRDELLAEWHKVVDLFFPNREPDDGWSADEIADAVKEIRRDLDDARGNAERYAADIRRVMAQRDAERARAETAERQRDEARDLARKHAEKFGV